MITAPRRRERARQDGRDCVSPAALSCSPPKARAPQGISPRRGRQWRLELPVRTSIQSGNRVPGPGSGRRLHNGLHLGSLTMTIFLPMCRNTNRPSALILLPDLPRLSPSPRPPHRAVFLVSRSAPRPDPADPLLKEPNSRLAILAQCRMSPTIARAIRAIEPGIFRRRFGCTDERAVHI